MKKLFFLLSIVSGLYVNAQDPTGRAQQDGIEGLDSLTIKDAREKLVELALQNPNYEAALANIRAARYDLAKSKGAWLGMFEATGNLNEITLKGTGAGATDPVTGLPLNNSLFFPRYNFSLRIPLDMFTGRANDVKMKKEALTMAQKESEGKAREIRKEVLVRFEDVLMHREKLEMQTRLLQSDYTDYMIAEKDFKDGLTTVEDFRKAEAAYFEQKMRTSEMQRNYNVAKIELEELVGIDLDTILSRL